MGGVLYKIDAETYKFIDKYDIKTPFYKIGSVLDGLLVFSSFNKVFTFDLLKKSKKEIITLSKEITHLSIENRNICTASLDVYFRTWSLSGVLISQINLYGPILSVCITSDFIFLGLVNGDLCKITIEEEKIEDEVQVTTNDRVKAFEKQIKQELIKNEIISSNKVESLIRKYAHVEALEMCLENNDVQDIFSVISHLQKDEKLINALTYMDKKYVYVLIDFIIENFFVVEFFDLFYDCLLHITSIYLQEIYNEDDLMDKINQLRDLIDQETYFQEKIIETVSLYECFEPEMKI